ncbi:MAG: 2-hydroxyacyl-CoA dehydratase [Candidatus Odinarchaeota archaeon]
MKWGDYTEIIREFKGIIESADSLVKSSKNNAKSMVFFTPNVPVEVITASGVTPVRICSAIAQRASKTSTDSILQPFTCPWIQLQLNLLLNESFSLDGVIFSENYCDSLLNFYNAYKKNTNLSIKFNTYGFLHPAKREYTTEIGYYLHELKQFTAWLEEWTGKDVNVNNLLESIRLHNEKRRLLRELSWQVAQDNNQMLFSEFFTVVLGCDIVPVEKAIDLLQKTVNIVKITGSNGDNTVNSHSINNVLISGNTFDNPRLLRKIPALDSYVKADDLSFGSRSFNFDVKVTSPQNDFDQLLMDIAHRYVVEKIPNGFHDDVTHRKEYISDQIKKYNISGVIFINYTYCDHGGLTSRRLTSFLENQGTKVLNLETDPQLSNLRKLTTRIEPFLEALTAGR